MVEQQRARVLAKAAAGDLGVRSAAEALGLVEAIGLAPQAAVQKRRRRAGSARADAYTGPGPRPRTAQRTKDCLYAVLLAERDGNLGQPVSVRRILRTAGIADPERRPPSGTEWPEPDARRPDS